MRDTLGDDTQQKKIFGVGAGSKTYKK